MSKNGEAQRLHTHHSKQKTDRRVLRTRDRLGDALIALMQEKPFDAITVQEVLDRAGVSRSTFYVHYRDKDDLFLSDADEFLEAMATMLSRREDKSDRVAAVREFFAHVGESRHLYQALIESGRNHDFLELAQGSFCPRNRTTAHRVNTGEGHCAKAKCRHSAGSRGCAADIDEVVDRSAYVRPARANGRALSSDGLVRYKPSS